VTSFSVKVVLTTLDGNPVLLLPNAALPPPNACPGRGASKDGLASKPLGGGGAASDPSSLVSVNVGESSKVPPVLRPLGCLSIIERAWRISLKACADTGAETCRMNGLEFAEYGPAPGERVSLGE